MAKYKTELEVKTGDGLPPPDDRQLGHLQTALNSLCALVPLVKFKVRLIGTERWRYEFEAVDGRAWLQEIDTHISGVVSLLTTISGEWTLAEIDRHRVVREELLPLLRTYAIDEIEVKWDV